MSFQLFLILNSAGSAMARKFSDSPSHADGPAYENARSANFVRSPLCAAAAACSRSTMLNVDQNGYGRH